MKKVKLSLPTIHCESCKKLILMETEDAGAKASVDVKERTAIIEFDEKRVKLGDLREALKDLGYNSEVIG